MDRADVPVHDMLTDPSSDMDTVTNATHGGVDTGMAIATTTRRRNPVRNRHRTRVTAPIQPTVEWYDPPPPAPAPPVNSSLSRRATRSSRSSRPEPSISHPPEADPSVRPPDPFVRSRMIADHPPVSFFPEDLELERALEKSRRLFHEERARKTRVVQEQTAIANEHDEILRSVRGRISWRHRFAENEEDRRSWSDLSHFVDSVRALRDRRDDDAPGISEEEARTASRAMNVIPLSEIDKYRPLNILIENILRTFDR